MRRLLRITAIAFVILVTGSAIGWGAARISRGVPDSAGVIHGCYLLRGHDAGLVRLLPAADTCPKGEQAISWSQTGPQGPAGPAGAQGPAGPQGPTGAAGATGATATTTVRVVSGSVVNEVDCPTGYVATGGGAENPAGSPVQYLVASFPVMTGNVPTGWFVRGAHMAFVICVKS